MKDSNKNTNFTRELTLIWENRILLLVAGFIPAIAIFITTYFVEPRYKSTAIVYPASFDTHDKMQITQGSTLLILQILESNNLRDTIIKRFNLVSHYHIDTSFNNWEQKLYAIYNKNIKHERTVLKSIQINVLDKNPQFAASLANGVAETVNLINNSMVKQHKKPILDDAKKNYENKIKHVERLTEELKAYKVDKSQERLDMLYQIFDDKLFNINNLRDSLALIRENASVHELSNQLDILQREYIDTKSKYLMEQSKYQVYREKFSERDSMAIKSLAKAEGLKQKAALLENEISKLNKANGAYSQAMDELAQQTKLRDQLAEEIERIQRSYEPGVLSVEMQKMEATYQAELVQLNLLRKDYEETKAQFYLAEPAVYLISKAIPSYAPAYPKKLLYAAIAFLLSMTLACFLLLILKSSK